MRILIETDPARGGWQLVGRIVALLLVLTVLAVLGGYLFLREAERIEPLIPAPASAAPTPAGATEPAIRPQERSDSGAPAVPCLRERRYAAAAPAEAESRLRPAARGTAGPRNASIAARFAPAATST